LLAGASGINPPALPRKVHGQALAYLKKRVGLRKYGEWREQDLVLASGVVEGAAR
jgi:hypothetical protein